MSPDEFIAKWRGSELTERAAAQSHFNDLCSVLGVPSPTDADQRGADYTFEKSTRKIGDTAGFADVWKKGCFAWEYKGKRSNLVQAYAQLKQYADALENPPLLIVSDMQEIRVHTNFTNEITQTHVIPLADLRSVEARELLRNCFLHWERLRPTQTRESVTAEAAARFANIAVALRRHYDERRVAHFINKLVFCLFAEDIELLPDRVFADILDESIKRPDDFVPMLGDLFRAMANRNGRFGKAAIPWFNGGLFDDDDVLPLGINAVRDLMIAARLDWKAIDPTIFGTLFESGLDDKKRTEMASLFDAPDPEDHTQASLFNAPTADRGVGIHYTDEATIMKIIEPVVVAPLRREWEQTRAEIRDADERRARARAPAEKERLLARARGVYAEFRASLGRYRVLDPACGSGNFLALSLRALKDFDLAVTEDAAAMGLPPDDYRVGPEAVLGIEINAYAAELARLTVWIAELQWQLRKGLGLTRRPILDKLDGIVRGDALITQGGNDTAWPEADVVVGNPPFLGGKRMRRSLGNAYVERLFAAFAGRVPAEADLVAYWFAKAWERLREGRLKRAGLVATNSMRGGANRRVLDAVVKDGNIFDAWDDEKWVVKGVAVRVSLICFAADATGPEARLDGKPVERVNADLTSSRFDLTRRRPLRENKNVCFVGVILNGEFEVNGEVARLWLCEPNNVNARPNTDVLRPTLNGDDFNGTRPDKWVVDFGINLSERAAASYQSPYTYIEQRVKPFRHRLNEDGGSSVRAKSEREIWWRHARPRPAMRRALSGLRRYIATPMVSSYRTFCFLDSAVLPDQKLVVFARADEFFLGLVQSLIHEAWTIRTCSWIGAGNDVTYSNQSVFLTFPFPDGLTPNIPAAAYADDPRAVAIAEAARRLNELREAWLNPPDLVERVPEVVPGFPDRIVPVNPKAAAILKTRTLTNLYNERPAWLDNAHRDLDAAVAAAYGWPADISEDEALARLLALNLERSS